MICILTTVAAALLAAPAPESARWAAQGAYMEDSAGRPSLERVVELIRRETNAFRGERGRDLVGSNDDLQAAAKEFAEFMARTDEYGHRADGRSPAERVRAQGYSFCIVLENIGYAVSSVGFEARELAETFVDGWIDSPRHRENLLDRDVTEIGIGLARSGQSGRYYAVQKFGRPRDDSIRFRITNRSGTAIAYKIGGERHQLESRQIVTHEQCRPPRLHFPWTDEIFRPSDSDHFVVRRDSDGELTVRTE